MSSTIWTRCAASSEVGQLSLSAIRVVESQAQSSTRKLVDTADEHELLEQLLEGSKPPAPKESQGLSYLLFTPFRYPPLRYGSRFGRRHERGIWYGSLSLQTALSEVAYYRLRFMEGSAAFGPDSRLSVALTWFSAIIDTTQGIDLTGPRFADAQRELRAKDSYATTQPLGTEMRAAGVASFLFASARDAEAGKNVGVFAPEAFARPQPSEGANIECYATLARVEFTERTLSRTPKRHIFKRSQFEVAGQLPQP